MKSKWKRGNRPERGGNDFGISLFACSVFWCPCSYSLAALNCLAVSWWWTAVMYFTEYSPALLLSAYFPIYSNQNSMKYIQCFTPYQQLYSEMTKGYVNGEVLPMIQKIERLTAKATTPDKHTIIWKENRITFNVHVRNGQVRSNLPISNIQP